MTAQNLNPYEMVPPRRPDVDLDFGSAAGEDDPDNPPPDNTYPSASVDNTKSRVSASHGRVVPHTILTIDFSAGAPVLVALSSTNPTILLGANSFTVVRHPSGDAAGDFNIVWPAGYVPAPIADAEASVTADVDAFARTAPLTAVSVRLRTRLSGAGVDVRCQVKLY